MYLIGQILAFSGAGYGLIRIATLISATTDRMHGLKRLSSREMEIVMNAKFAISVASALFLTAAASAYAQPIGTVPGDPYVLGQHPEHRGYVPLERQMRRSN